LLGLFCAVAAVVVVEALGMAVFSILTALSNTGRPDICDGVDQQEAIGPLDELSCIWVFVLGLETKYVPYNNI